MKEMKQQKNSPTKLVNNAEAKITIKKGTEIKLKNIISQTNIKNFDRSNTTVSETAKEFIITIKAKDLTALRASVNSILRDLKVVEETSRAVPQITKK